MVGDVYAVVFTVPDVGVRRPVTALRVVDLPAPLGPRSPMNSPFLTVRSMSDIATKLPYLLVRLVTSIAGVVSIGHYIYERG